MQLITVRSCTTLSNCPSVFHLCLYSDENYSPVDKWIRRSHCRWVSDDPSDELQSNFDQIGIEIRSNYGRQWLYCDWILSEIQSWTCRTSSLAEFRSQSDQNPIEIRIRSDHGQILARLLTESNHHQVLLRMTSEWTKLVLPRTISIGGHSMIEFQSNYN